VAKTTVVRDRAKKPRKRKSLAYKKAPSKPRKKNCQNAARPWGEAMKRETGQGRCWGTAVRKPVVHEKPEHNEPSTSRVTFKSTRKWEKALNTGRKRTVARDPEARRRNLQWSGASERQAKTGMWGKTLRLGGRERKAVRI